MKNVQKKLMQTWLVRVAVCGAAFGAMSLGSLAAKADNVPATETDNFIACVKDAGCGTAGCGQATVADRNYLINHGFLVSAASGNTTPISLFRCHIDGVLCANNVQMYCQKRDIYEYPGCAGLPIASYYEKEYGCTVG